MGWPSTNSCAARPSDTPQVALLDSFFGRTRIAVGDLIAAEVLQGVRDDKEFKWVKKVFETFTRLDLCGYELAVKASENYRVLRGNGVTTRKTIDMLIATRCIEDGLTLLHSDRDFDPFVQHLGLRVAYSET
jgi:predicted nucleic acid-binding protein